jgi:alpha-L-fucosidase 2
MKHIMHKTNLSFLRDSFILLILFLYSFPCFLHAQALSNRGMGLHFSSLPSEWYKAVPLGDGMLGALVYEKGNHLRVALDRADLWDLRPVKNFGSPDFSYHWIYEHVISKNYDPVHKLVDDPYDQDAAPTKIPAGALEFPLTELGKVKSVDLNIYTATCRIVWNNGTSATFFISAGKKAGYFRFENLPQNSDPFSPTLIPPPYHAMKYDASGNATVGGQDLARLGYPNGIIERNDNSIFYHQQGWGHFSYDMAVSWKRPNANTLEGTWSITSEGSPYSTNEKALTIAKDALKTSFDKAWGIHKKWWADYWKQSSVTLPDAVIQHQYDMDMYLFASASRSGAPPITLQAVWTADNGKLPPWKGDYHNDLNTQLSYWPGYTANHLSESSAFTDWLWKDKPVFLKYTRQFFKDNGLDVPGVCTLTGEPMGGWGQYSLSPTVSCWLSQYFYWQWIYSGNTNFLKERAYPWVKAVAEHIESIAIKNKEGYWQLPISSSPEFFDNELKAWFLQTSNYDVSLIRWMLKTAVQMADTLHLPKEADHWKKFLSGWPELALNPADSALLVAPGIPYSFSHRHFSHLMSIYPLQLIDWYHGEKDQKIMQASLNELKKYGPSGWMGYSYAWLACLKAMNQDGEGADSALKIFATAFCSPNSFHLNGDQSGKGYSGATYNPFTLEGNFAFAKGVQLMLLQQHDGVNYIFPAVPDSWEHVSFKKLRVPGAFLISAKKENGVISEIEIYSIKGGTISLNNPFNGKSVEITGIKAAGNEQNKKIFVFSMKPGQVIRLTSPVASSVHRNKIVGADLSFLPQLEAHGEKFYVDGKQEDAIKILKDHGFNYIRLRIFVNPAEDSGYSPGKGFCDLAHTMQMAKRIKAAGMGFLLDFHYSDTWADPGKQFIPAAWKQDDFDRLKQEVYNYTKEVMTALKNQDTPPDMVQIGNEINHGILWPVGNISHPDSLAALLKAGIAAVKEVDPSAQIMLHIADGGQNTESRSFLDKMIARHVPFDLIGESYYPQWHGTLAMLTNNLTDLAKRYHQRIIVVEYTYHKKEVNNIVFTLPDHKGLGTFIWEPLNTWEAIFNKQGVANDSLLHIYSALAEEYHIH